MPAFGRRLAQLVLNEDVARVLMENDTAYLVIVHDAPTARIPWETLALPSARSATGVWFPAAEQGLSRRYTADDLSIAKWMEERREERGLRILLVVNPTLDLEGAEDEGASAFNGRVTSRDRASGQGVGLPDDTCSR